MDRIIIRNLHIYANHGVHSSEKELGQNFYVSAVLYTDLYKPGHTDELSDTVSYSDVSKLICREFTAARYDLIERVAYSVAECVMNEYPQIDGIELEVSKPEAPIGLDVENVSVYITLKRHTAYIAFGSNMGDRQGYIDRAIKMLDEHPDISVEAVSSVMETAPYGDVKQDDFLNGVLKINTYLTPMVLLERLNEIENALGRERIVHWGPRTIDLDIIFYDDAIMDTEKLTIPHPDMENREFVLAPLCEIAPNLIHPVCRRSMKEMLMLLSD